LKRRTLPCPKKKKASRAAHSVLQENENTQPYVTTKKKSFFLKNLFFKKKASRAAHTVLQENEITQPYVTTKKKKLDLLCVE
jgi:hypothetical protein